jgi:hypothetical protein
MGEMDRYYKIRHALANAVNLKSEWHCNALPHSVQRDYFVRQFPQPRVFASLSHRRMMEKSVDLGEVSTF